jgi:RHS repeat-associated protein
MLFMRQQKRDLSLLRFIYYDVLAGRFLTRDPIGFEGGINLYEYVGNCPLGRHDPSGLRSFVDPVNHVVGNPYVNCGVGAVISALQGNYSDVGNVLESLCQLMAACGSGYVCAAANATIGDISLEGPEVWWFTCLIGALCGALASMLADMCRGFNPCENNKPRVDWCDVVFGAIIGCLGGMCGPLCGKLGQIGGGLLGWIGGVGQSQVCDDIHRLVGF